jgi:hypothetical protein
MSRKAKPVEAIEISTGIPTVYPSLIAFCEAVGASYTHAVKVVSQSQMHATYHSCKGYSLMYLEDQQ